MWVLLLLCVAVSGYELWLMTSTSTETGGGLFVLCGANGVLGLAAYASLGTVHPRGLADHWRRIVWPGVFAIGAEVLIGCALFPATLRDGAEADLTWFPAVAVTVVLVGILGYLFAVFVGMLVIGPVIAVALRAPAAVRGDREARYLVLVSLLLLDIVAMATALTLSTNNPGRSRGVLTLAATLLGLTPHGEGSGAPVESDTLFWCARALALFLVALLVMAIRAGLGGRGLNDRSVSLP